MRAAEEVGPLKLYPSPDGLTIRFPYAISSSRSTHHVTKFRGLVSSLRRRAKVIAVRFKPRAVVQGCHIGKVVWQARKGRQIIRLVACGQDRMVPIWSVWNYRANFYAFGVVAPKGPASVVVNNNDIYCALRDSSYAQKCAAKGDISHSIPAFRPPLPSLPNFYAPSATGHDPLIISPFDPLLPTLTPPHSYDAAEEAVLPDLLLVYYHARLSHHYEK